MLIFLYFEAQYQISVLQEFGGDSMSNIFLRQLKVHFWLKYVQFWTLKGWYQKNKYGDPCWFFKYFEAQYWISFLHEFGKDSMSTFFYRQIKVFFIIFLHIFVWFLIVLWNFCWKNYELLYTFCLLRCYTISVNWNLDEKGTEDVIDRIIMSCPYIAHKSQNVHQVGWS